MKIVGKQHDKEVIQIMRDPVKWAAKHLGGDKPRWYQEEILRHPHNRKVLRCGRRIGKCIAGDQRILDPITGSYTAIEELYQQQKESNSVNLLTLNETYQLENSNAFFIEDNGVKEVFRVKTKHGAEVLLTGNHPVLTIDGWVEVDLLEVGDSIAVPRKLDHKGTITENDYVKGIKAPERAAMLGYLVAGGRVFKDSLCLESRFESVQERMQKVFENHDGVFAKIEKRKQSYELWIPHHLNEFKFIAEEARLGILPEEVYQYDKTVLECFIAALYDVGGWDYAKRIVEIGYGTPNHEFARNLKHLLLRLGIKSNILKKHVNDTEYFHVMTYYREHVIRFIDCVRQGNKTARDYSNTYRRALEMQSMDETLPKDVWKHIEKERREKKMTKTQVSGSKTERLRMNHGLSKGKARVYADNMQSAFLYDLVYSDVLWEEVVAIESVGMRPTYDVFVPETHNLVVEDILVHNTWTMTAHMLWVAYTCNGGTEIAKGATCLVATPYDSQAREIFDQLTNFIDNNDALKASVQAVRRSPYEIVFHNKSRIKLFTAGTRSGAEGGSLRGQKASWLYMDKLLSLMLVTA